MAENGGSAESAIGAGFCRRLALFVVVALGLALRVAPADAQGIEPQAVQAYSKEYEVPPTEADQRLSLQARASDIVEQLRGSLGSAYAGVWFDNERGEFVVPVIGDESRTSVAGEMADDTIGAGRYRLEQAQHTWKELEATQDVLNKELRGLFELSLVKTGLDARSNSVVVELAGAVPRSKVAEIASLAGAQPVSVEVVQSAEERFRYSAQTCGWVGRRRCDTPLHAGVEIVSGNLTRCTSAFPVRRNGDGVPFLLTAGHCVKGSGTYAYNWFAWTYNETQLTIGPGHTYIYATADTDGGLIAASGSTWVEQGGWHDYLVVWGPPSNPGAIQNPGLVITGSASSYAGLYACHSGRTTGSSCGTVQKTGVKVTYSGGEKLERMVELYGACGEGGDSGGPVYSGSTALGVWSGGMTGCNTTHYYSGVPELESRFGVHIMGS